MRRYPHTLPPPTTTTTVAIAATRDDERERDGAMGDDACGACARAGVDAGVVGVGADVRAAARAGALFDWRARVSARRA